MSEEIREEVTQEVAQAAEPPEVSQEPANGGEVEEQTQQVPDWIRKELKKLRAENAEWRNTNKTLKEQLKTFESTLNALREQLALESAHRELMARLGDPQRAEMALKLARADGLIRLEGERAQVDVDALLERYPLLRARTVAADTGANPVGAPKPVSLEDAVKEKLFGRR